MLSQTWAFWHFTTAWFDWQAETDEHSLEDKEESHRATDCHYLLDGVRVVMQLASPHPPLISVAHSLLVQKHAHSSGVCPLLLLSCFSHLHCIVTVLRALWSLDTFASTRELITLPQTYVNTPPPTVRGIPFRSSCDSEGVTPETPITQENLLVLLSICLLSNKSRGLHSWDNHTGSCSWELWV